MKGLATDEVKEGNELRVWFASYVLGSGARRSRECAERCVAWAAGDDHDDLTSLDGGVWCGVAVQRR